MSKEAVIVSAVRSPIGRAGGTLGKAPPEYYGAEVIKEAVKRINLDPAEISDVIFGNCLNAGGNIARLCALMAGLPLETPGITVDRQCGSGLNAVNLAAQAVMAGMDGVYVAGGTESCSLKPYVMEHMEFFSKTPPKFRAGFQLSPEEIGNPPMGITAENLAEKYEISRLEQDEFSLGSQQKMGKAMEEGLFKSQIVPLKIPVGKGKTVVFDTDEHPRPQTTLEGLSKLPPAFKAGGTVTAGNSSGLNDAAAAVIVMSLDRAKGLGLMPLAKIRTFAVAGVDPNIMGIGPVPATRKALAQAGLALDDIELIELNEAFAAQVLAVHRELKFNMDKVNVNGGAIAHGHPIGATGAILTTKLVYEMSRRDVQFGLLTACIGGGQGIATILERV
ncbi:acetyl-CoA acetyltransferase [Desulfosporosinus acidiphilus SJ4]|uniref:Acetyl-CoA acetyltransferase n=1 Tax=Desulfosporosinus acidiphilus (strain DSM 22704 / JCM 16185 / SJ4) TaxID=646529 RepID=I4D1T6_DESAJ|nr:thiolase family protein [Desulfosporosinus acidiphilus]AFM39760.1 acetyl-CoA acetyltransferase [Desulfosporosinus acidiphilus SJ4]